MDVLMWVLFGVLPAVAAVLVLVGVGGPRWLALALAVAIGVPFLIADGWAGWPWRLDLVRGAPRPVMWWMLVFAGLIGTGHDFRVLPRWLAITGEVVLVLLLPWVVSAPLRGDGSFEQCVAFLGAGWLVIGGSWWSLRGAAKAHPGVSVPLAMTVVLGVDAWLLRRQVSGPDWQLAGVAATALGFALLTTTWRRPFVLGAGAVLCMALAHSGFLLCERDPGDLLRPALLLAWMAPIGFLLGRTRWLRERPRSAAVCSTSAVILLASGAAWLSVSGA